MIRATKIVATLGPASASKSAIMKLARAGMNVARLNCAHGDWVTRARMIRDVREVSQTLGRPIGVLLDLSGPKIRLGKLPEGAREIRAGQTIFLSPTQNGPDTLPLPIPEVFDACRKHSRILLGDGFIELRAVDVNGDTIETRAMTSGVVKSNQGVTLVGNALPLSPITEKDLDDLRTGYEEGVDFVALSYVRSADDVRELKKAMRQLGGLSPIVAKIETREAIRDIEDIIDESSAIMVARGDLGLQIDMEEIPLLQKKIIHACNRAGKPVITATQMLESMVTNPRPTRAEATDVANAILDGTDAVMLSGETAAGQFPTETVRFMDRIARQTQRSGEEHRPPEGPPSRETDSTLAVARAACELADELKVRAIVTSTTSGHTTQMVSKFRPRTMILGTTPVERTYRCLSMVWGVQPLLIDPVRSTDEMISESITAARERKLVKAGDSVVVTAGVPIGVPGNTNLILVRKV